MNIDSFTSRIYHARIGYSELREALGSEEEEIPQWTYTKVSDRDEYDAILPTLVTRGDRLFVSWKYNIFIDVYVPSNSRVVVAVKDATWEVFLSWQWNAEIYVAGNSSAGDLIDPLSIGPGSTAASAHDPALFLVGRKVYLAYEQNLDVFILEADALAPITWRLGNSANSPEGSLSSTTPNDYPDTSTQFFSNVTRHRFVHLSGNDSHVVAIWTGTYSGRSRDPSNRELGVPPRIDCYGSILAPTSRPYDNWIPLENSGNPSGAPESLPDIPTPPYMVDLTGSVLFATPDGSGIPDGVVLYGVEKYSRGVSLSSFLDLARNPHLVISEVTDKKGFVRTDQTLIGLYRVQNSLLLGPPLNDLGEVLTAPLSNLSLIPDPDVSGTYLDFGAKTTDRLQGTVYYDYFSTNRPGVIVYPPDGSVHFAYLKINRMEEDDWGTGTVIEFCYQEGVLT